MSTQPLRFFIQSPAEAVVRFLFKKVNAFVLTFQKHLKYRRNVMQSPWEIVLIVFAVVSLLLGNTFHLVQNLRP